MNSTRTISNKSEGGFTNINDIKVLTVWIPIQLIVNRIKNKTVSISTVNPKVSLRMYIFAGRFGLPLTVVTSTKAVGLVEILDQ